jgi:single-strand DNA-binding protein
MNEVPLTVTGNLTGDPELRYTPNGDAVANFTIASTGRRYNTQTEAWEDGDTVFLRCNLWRQAAEHLAESVSKGDRVIATGRLKQRVYETAEGEKRSSYELDAHDAGPSVLFRPARVAAATRDQAAANERTRQPVDAAEPAL